MGQLLEVNAIERVNIKYHFRNDDALTLEECLESYARRSGGGYVSDQSLEILMDLLEEMSLAQKSDKEHIRSKLLKAQVKVAPSPAESFRASNLGQLISKFAYKFGDQPEQADVLKLQRLLASKGYALQESEVMDLVENESWRRRDAMIELRAFTPPPSSLEEAVKNYVLYCEDSRDETFISFGLLLKDKGLYMVAPEKEITTDALFDLLATKVKEAKDQIEIERFEQRLHSDDENFPIEEIDSLSGYEFEAFLANLFSKMGFTVEHTRLTGDQGADLVVVRLGEKTVIQAKRFGGKVGNSGVQEIMAAISLYKAQRGMVVTSNYFTTAAMELAEANDIELIDRDGLAEWISKYW